MNTEQNELIKRIDIAEPHCDEYMRELLANCKAEIERLSELRKDSLALGLKFAQDREAMDDTIERLSKPYVPMSLDELAMKADPQAFLQRFMFRFPHLATSAARHVETAVIKRYNEQRGIE